jgi:hypothetical protein
MFIEECTSCGKTFFCTPSEYCSWHNKKMCNCPECLGLDHLEKKINYEKEAVLCLLKTCGKRIQTKEELALEEL